MKEVKIGDWIEVVEDEREVVEKDGDGIKKTERRVGQYLYEFLELVCLLYLLTDTEFQFLH